MKPEAPHPLKLYPRHNQVLLAWSDAWSQYAALSESSLFFATEREVGGPNSLQDMQPNMKWVLMNADHCQHNLINGEWRQQLTHTH